MKLSEDLKWRGLIKDSTSPEIDRILDEEKITAYWGTDPSGDSLHLGHLSSVFLLKRLADYGHKPIILVGGATGLIGDPKPNAERAMITHEELDSNYQALKNQIANLFNYEMVNNYDWTKDMSYIDCLRDYGKYFPVNYMLNKDTVKRRLETGITYTEFSYMIMQAFDFLYLYENKNCTFQVAGSDQWGNITAGVDLIKKKIGKEAYAFTMPLILDKEGNKFGKSEGNALWIDKNKTSSYELYQFLVNTGDDLVIHYLKVLTFLTREEIENLEKELQESPEKRSAQKALAKNIITILHGEEEYKKAVNLSEVLFSGNVSNLSAKEIEMVFSGVDEFFVEKSEKILDFLVNNGIVISKREGREFLEAGSITINGEKILDLEEVISKEKAIDNKYIIVRKGKKKYYLGKF